MGTYHLIDGSKVRVFYRGNDKTCGRCHKVARECPGEAVARNCAAGSGVRVFLSDHMKQLWKEVGFVPTTFELEESDKSVDDIEQAEKDASVIDKTRLPPTVHREDPNDRDIENYDGITVRNIPKNTDDKDIHVFLVNNGLPIDHEKEHIKINKNEKNTWIFVDGLCKEDVQTMMKSIHFPVTNQKFFDVPLYCKALRNMTPKKIEKPTTSDTSKVAVTKETEVAKIESQNENDKIPKQVIPGLPEAERLKQPKLKKKKQKKKSNKEEETPIKDLTRPDFLISPVSGALKKTEVLENFEFSEYDDDTEDEEFEDSRETISDTENTPGNEFLTPVNLKSTFARNLANSSAKPAPTTNANKRAAKSPAETKENKKSRGQSQTRIPKKK